MQPMYKKLLQLPLFQGLSQKEMTEIIEKVVFQFESKPANTLLAQQDQDCGALLYILHGTISKKTTSHDQNHTLEQIIEAPILIEPHSLFGKDTQYQSTYTSLSEVDTITIDKRFVMTELMDYPIFKLNYINILSCTTQNQQRLLRNPKTSNELVDRFTHFIKQRVDTNHQAITLYATMEELAFQLNDTRLNVSKMLNKLSQENKLELKRKVIIIPDFRLI